MTIFEMSVSGAVLIAAILLLRLVLLHRLPKWTFLLLWGVALCRLLIPVRLPAPTSIYTGAAQVIQQVQEEAPDPIPELPSVIVRPGQVPAVTPPSPAPAVEAFSPARAVYWAGAALCALFFAAVYGWNLRRFRGAAPVTEEWVLRWQAEHPALFPIQIKTSENVTAPLAYGLLRPKILLPQDAGWSERDQLVCVLTHEYVHIRRGDLLWKLLLAATLCLHWCNPLVWCMYFCANRDLELACDETVVRILGLNSRKGYAYALLAAEESRFSPLCTTYTTKNHMEERIRAIMKIKKQTLAALLAGVLLVAGVTAVFATSRMPSAQELEKLPLAAPSEPVTAPDPAPAQKFPDAGAPAGTIGGESWKWEIVPPQEGDEAVSGRVHPVTGTPAQPQEPDPAPVEPASPAPAATASDSDENFVYVFNPEDPIEFWGLPDGPIAKGTTLYARTEEEYHEMIQQLRLKGYAGSFAVTGQLNNGGYFVILADAYDGVQRDLLVPDGIMPDWTYPVNSKGETYGTLFGRDILGYEPDLIGYYPVSEGEEEAGFLTLHDWYYLGYPGTPKSIFDPDYHAWLKTQPKRIKVPIYDVEHENILGYWEYTNSESGNYTVTQEEQDRMVETVREKLLERGYSQEEIDVELERVRQENPVAPPDMTLDEKREAYGW